MSAATHKGRAERPSLLRQLFASLRSKPATPSTTEIPQAASPPVAASLLAISGPTVASNTATKPAPAPEPAAKRQISLVDPPGSNRTDRVFATQDFLNRFRRIIVKSGVTARDPVLPILEMLGEMLVHFTHVTEDLNGDLNGQTKRMAAELRVGTEQARGLLTEHIRIVERVTSQAAVRIENAAATAGVQRAAQLQAFSEDTEALLRRTVIEQTRTRLWTSLIAVACLIAGVGGGSYWVGRQAGVDQATAEARAVQADAILILMRDGLKAAQQWVNLAAWNNLSIVKPTCAPQVSGAGYRLACTYAFWAAPPIPTAPAPQ